MTAPLLVVDQLAVVYQHVITAIQGVSLTVERGRIVALLGTNGAGKTTTLRAISGFLGVDNARVTEGSIRYKGIELAGLPPHAITAHGIVLVPERDKVFPNLTVAENLDANVPRRGATIDRKRIAESVYEFFPALARLKKREAGYLSGGERQMLAIGTALMCGPELLAVDELSLGLAPIIVEELARALKRMISDEGTAVILVEQHAEVALSLTEDAILLERGTIVHRARSADLLTEHATLDRYIGLRVEGG